METEFLHIVAAEHISDYMLRLSFSNGQVRLFDFSRIYNKGIFTKLKDKNYFLNYTLDGLTVDAFFSCAEKYIFLGRKIFFSGQEKKFLSFGAYFASSVNCQLSHVIIIYYS